MADPEPPSSAFRLPAPDELDHVFETLLWLVGDHKRDETARDVQQHIGTCRLVLATIGPAARKEAAWLAYAVASALALSKTAKKKRDSDRTRPGREKRATKNIILTQIIQEGLRNGSSINEIDEQLRKHHIRRSKSALYKARARLREGKALSVPITDGGGTVEL
jgi:hypothetical protein